MKFPNWIKPESGQRWRYSYRGTQYYQLDYIAEICKIHYDNVFVIKILVVLWKGTNWSAPDISVGSLTNKYLPSSVEDDFNQRWSILKGQEKS